MNHVRESYSKPEMKARKALAEERAKGDLKQIEEMMRKRREGLSLGEKIAIHEQKIDTRDCLSVICDSHFQTIVESGAVYQLRRTNLQREDGRTLNISEEVEFKLPEIVEEEKEETKISGFDKKPVKPKQKVEETKTTSR